ncbi:MAG: hypothetical protein K0S93_1044 [Nitrososphaeraceae archaeon]|nr:hypothetical protein [Nitrososphaeraceae archaeon]
MKFQHISRNNVLMVTIMTSMLLTISNTNLVFSQSNSNSLNFEDPILGVKFQYTDEWIKEGSSLFGANTECSSLPCMRLPEISVSVSPIVTEDFSLENYTQEQSFYHNLSEGYKPIALNETKIGEKKAFQYAYSTKSPLLMEEVSNEIMNYEIYTTEGINLFKLSFTAIIDEQLDKYLKSFKKISETLEIIR